jgi:hypothetical protein
MNTIKRVAPASVSYGRGRDNYSSRASYVVVNAAGERIGAIMGSDTRHFEKSAWTVEWFDAKGFPRTVCYADSFKHAKAFAATWDGSAPASWRARV